MIFHGSKIDFQRRGAKEQLEQSAPEFLHTENPDEEIVVDEEKENCKQIEREFVVPGGQIIGLDQAVLQSIERCREYSLFILFLT